MCEVCFIRHRENGPGFSTRWTSASATSPASYTTFEELKFEILRIHVSPSQERERIQSTSPFRLLPIAIEKRTTSFFDPCFACLFLCCSYSRLQPVQACLDLANLKTSISMVKTWDASITSSEPMHFWPCCVDNQNIGWLPVAKPRWIWPWCTLHCKEGSW